MASICAAQPSQLIHRLQTPSTRSETFFNTANLKLSTSVSHSSFNSRLKDIMKLQIRERLLAAYASNSNPSSREYNKDKPDRKTSDAGQGPPVLTILAGFLVFFLLIWVFGSFITWLFGLIVKGPPSK